jgi:hypothetical protein
MHNFILGQAVDMSIITSVSSYYYRRRGGISRVPNWQYRGVTPCAMIVPECHAGAEEKKITAFICYSLI